MAELQQNLEGVSLLGNQNTKYKYKYDPSILEKFENNHRDSDDIVSLDAFEFVSRCPRTGQPDFATIHISYIADEYLVESKSLKLYLFSFQQHGAFHETCVHQIMQDLVEFLQPRYLEVFGDFNSRGGISILPFAAYATEEFKDFKRQRQLAVMNTTMTHRPRTS